MGNDWPDVAALELLIGIDDCGSLGAASRRIGMAQPNASRAIRRLESRFGLSLVRRTPRGSTLTAEGTVIVHWARQVVADLRQLVDAAASLRVETEPALTIASSLTIAEYLLPQWLGRFRHARPDVHVHLQMLNSMQVFDRIDDGSCDIGFVEGPMVPDHLNKITVATDRLVVVVHPGHAWARRRRPLAVAELASTPLLAREPGSGTRRTLDLALAEYERPAPLLELASSAAIRASVLGGIGPAVMSTLAVADQVASRELVVVELAGLNLDRTLRAVWRPPRRLGGPAGELLASILREKRERP